MTLNSVIQYIINLGPTVVLPIIIFIIALIMRLPVGRAFRAAVIIGVGFVGINLVVGLLGGVVGPAAEAMVQHTHVNLNFLDVGWPSTAAIAYGATVGALAIPVGLVTDLLMLWAGLTVTLDIDLWNYWHIAFAGAIVAILTRNAGYGIFAEVVSMVLLLALADWSQPWIKRHFGYDNLTFPHGTSAPYFVMALLFDKLFDAIPGLKHWQASPDALRKAFGVFGDTMILGLIFGLLIGVIAGQTLAQILTLGITVAAVMVILPRMVAILMEGLIPIADGASELLQKRFPGRKLFLGMDTAILIGDPTTIAASVVMVPITLGLAFVLPGNRVLPFIDLATIPFILALMTPVFRGNVIRTLIGGTLAMIPTLYIATNLGPFMTTAAAQVGFKFPANATHISSLVDGGNLLPWVIKEANVFGIVGISALFVLSLGFAWLIRSQVTHRQTPSQPQPAAPKTAAD
jgi:PTS system galactitol-specific IIC component